MPYNFFSQVTQHGEGEKIEIQKTNISEFLKAVDDEEVATVLTNLSRVNAKTITKEKLVKTIKAMADTFLEMVRTQLTC